MRQRLHRGRADDGVGIGAGEDGDQVVPPVCGFRRWSASSAAADARRSRRRVRLRPFGVACGDLTPVGWAPGPGRSAVAAPAAMVPQPGRDAPATGAAGRSGSADPGRLRTEGSSPCPQWTGSWLSATDLSPTSSLCCASSTPP